MSCFFAQQLARALGTASGSLTGLDLGSNDLGNGGTCALAEALKQNTVLTSLDLRSCNIHLKGIVAMADCAMVNTTLRCVRTRCSTHDSSPHVVLLRSFIPACHPSCGNLQSSGFRGQPCQEPWCDGVGQRSGSQHHLDSPVFGALRMPLHCRHTLFSTSMASPGGDYPLR